MTDSSGSEAQRFMSRRERREAERIAAENAQAQAAAADNAVDGSGDLPTGGHARVTPSARRGPLAADQPEQAAPPKRADQVRRGGSDQEGSGAAGGGISDDADLDEDDDSSHEIPIPAQYAPRPSRKPDGPARTAAAPSETAETSADSDAGSAQEASRKVPPAPGSPARSTDSPARTTGSPTRRADAAGPASAEPAVSADKSSGAAPDDAAPSASSNPPAGLAASASSNAGGETKGDQPRFMTRAELKRYRAKHGLLEEADDKPEEPAPQPDMSAPAAAPRRGTQDAPAKKSVAAADPERDRKVGTASAEAAQTSPIASTSQEAPPATVSAQAEDNDANSSTNPVATPNIFHPSRRPTVPQRRGQSVEAEIPATAASRAAESQDAEVADEGDPADADTARAGDAARESPQSAELPSRRRNRTGRSPVVRPPSTAQVAVVTGSLPLAGTSALDRPGLEKTTWPFAEDSDLDDNSEVSEPPVPPVRARTAVNTDEKMLIGSKSSRLPLIALGTAVAIGVVLVVVGLVLMLR
ncbi:hypothetical protein LWF01_09585 [Saxibacter everestensis]|uniref:Uncharacterized protein n=1 Tax=Saxibacter everestensis TaxID=2909229 RepID=A0ABY8QY94_9MICO|nr:hypothetical protein LWF01_09585 [Brevibacteriaceae bacterium ZFBP1038]